VRPLADLTEPEFWLYLAASVFCFVLAVALLTLHAAGKTITLTAGVALGVLIVSAAIRAQERIDQRRESDGGRGLKL
jgi:hypothetical protein